jgi:hypothetical protein
MAREGINGCKDRTNGFALAYIRKCGPELVILIGKMRKKAAPGES